MQLSRVWFRLLESWKDYILCASFVLFLHCFIWFRGNHRRPCGITLICHGATWSQKLLLLARLINRQAVVFRGFDRRSPQRFHCQCGQPRYRRHTEAESRISIAGIGRSANQKGIWRAEKVRKFWLPTVSVGDPVTKRQLPLASGFRSKDARRARNRNIDYSKQHCTPHCWSPARFMDPTNSTKRE